MEHDGDSRYVPGKNADFLGDYMKACFVEDVLMAIEEEGLNKLGLARRLGKSRQYVGRILKERANLTIHSVAKLAAALNRDVVLRLKRHDQVASIREYVPSGSYWTHTREIELDAVKDAGSYSEDSPARIEAFSAGVAV